MVSESSALTVGATPRRLGGVALERRAQEQRGGTRSKDRDASSDPL
jgi:hypothetical protein